jgi:hypothetical protein
MNNHSLAVLIAKKILEDKDTLFCLNFEGSVAVSDFEGFVKVIRNLLPEHLELDYSSIMHENQMFQHLKMGLKQIDDLPISVQWKSRKKLRLLAEVTSDV